MLVDNLMVVGFLRTCYSWSLSLSLFSITKIPKRSLCAYIYISISIQKKRTLVKTKKTTIINNENNDNAIDVDIFITSSISFFKKDRVRKVSTINNVNIDEFVNKSQKSERKLKQLSLQTTLLKLHYFRILYLQLRSTNYVNVLLLRRTRL